MARLMSRSDASSAILARRRHGPAIRSHRLNTRSTCVSKQRRRSMAGMADQKQTAFYLRIGLGAFAVIVLAIVVGILIVDEIRKAEIRSLLRDAQQKRDADAKQRDDAAASTQDRQTRIAVLTEQIKLAEQQYRDAEAAVNQSIVATTRKEEVEESDRRYKEAKRIEIKLNDLREKLKNLGG